MIDLVIDTIFSTLFFKDENCHCLNTIGNFPVLCHILENIKNVSLFKNIYVLIKKDQKNLIEKEVKRWCKKIEKAIIYIEIFYSKITPSILHDLVENDIIYIDLSFPFLSFQFYEWLCKSIDREQITVILANFKQEHFVDVQLLQLPPPTENALLLNGNEKNLIRFMNMFYLPNNLKSVFLENKNIQVFEHVYKLFHLRAMVVPRYFMSYDALPLLNNREKEYMEFMYRKQNHSNSTMEFYYLWKQIEKMEQKICELSKNNKS